MCLTQSWSTEVTLILTSSCRRCNWSLAGSRTSHAWATPSRGKNNLRRFLYPKIAQIQFGRKVAVCGVFLFRRSFTPDGQYDSSLDSCCVHWNCIVGINSDNHFTIGLSGRAGTCPSRCVFGLPLTSRRFRCSPRDVRYDTGASRCVLGMFLTIRRFRCSLLDVRYDTGALQDASIGLSMTRRGFRSSSRRRGKSHFTPVSLETTLTVPQDTGLTFSSRGAPAFSL